MSKPVVAIVGRPNVGKSTLFNALAGDNISIVKDTPGVTRDRIYADVTWLDRTFTLIDTGGIEPDSSDIILSRMREQAQIAIDTADVIIFITDVRQGLVDSDAKVADMLRRSGKPVRLVVNKVDSHQKYMMDVYEFYNLGIGEPIPISAANRQGLGDMLDEVIKEFPDKSEEEDQDDIPKIAIVGKPNVGKSSLINKLLGEERVIVSNIAGTTRDAIDTKVTWNKKDYIFIDTAGLRRKGKVKEEIERYSVIRTVTAVERADVVVVVIDASEGVTEQDAKIAGIAHDRGKGIIVAVNKWDAIEKNDKTIYKHTEKIRQILSFMPYAQIIFISAKTGQRLPKLFENIDTVIENQTLRIQTGVLNEILSEAVALQQPPSDRGRRLKIFYMTQVAVKPPTFVIFVNDKELMHFSYVRYLENKIRDAFGFSGTSLKFIIRERGETYYLSCYRLCMRAFSDRLYYWKSPQDRYQRSWQRECGYYECLPDLWKESGSDHPAGRLPEVCTGYCDRENGLWKFHEWSPSASYPLCSIGMYPRPQFSDFYGISRWKGNCCFCRHDHCF